VEQYSIDDDRSKLNSILSLHNVMGLATIGPDGPHVAPVFYVVANDGLELVFMSKASAQHSQHITANPKVSACIFLDTSAVKLLHGIQITGSVDWPQRTEQGVLRNIYYKTYPYARLAKFASQDYQIYRLRIETAKLIDNQLGFGKSFLWDFRPNLGACDSPVAAMNQQPVGPS